MKVVNKGLEVRLYPDEDMVQVLEQNIGNARFTWNRLLDGYQKTYSLFKQHGYTTLKCNMATFNTMLNMLKKEYSFLRLSESSSLQQVFRDLINSFNKFFKKGSGYPRFKSKRNPKQSFRIQNNNNIKFKNNVVVFPKIGPIYFRTSKEYKKILNSNDTKINNVTIKRHNGKYYAVFNVETPIEMFDKTFESVGIDLGLRTLATLSNELKKAKIDVTHENEMIKKYQRKLARKKPGSKRYKKTQQTYWKWQDKKTNKIKDAQHKISHNLAKYYDLICMENLDIKKMFENKNISNSLQNTGLASLVDKIKYKCQWNDKEFIQISRWFPSSKKCHNCGYIHHNLKDEKTWNCPKCGKHHDRDINASKNILQEGTRILREKIMNLWYRGDSTVILEALASTAREVRILEVYTSR
ncbi:RNA-guided endonuclease InsQ/TnpB family protein [Methanobrevibacter sp.]|uniref:RNA-guided endonuclease InsQ/TnpB family protein n=1 Tax=Methanobrevibacter sp. TaxID=66852 RepID=UPI00388EB91B